MINLKEDTIIFAHKGEMARIGFWDNKAGVNHSYTKEFKEKNK